MNKGKFTRLDLCKDGSIYLQFDYKKLFFKANKKARFEFEKFLMENFMGLIDVKVHMKGKEINIYLHIGSSAKNIQEGVPSIIDLEEAAEHLSRLCSNY